MMDRHFTRNAYVWHAYEIGTPVHIISRDFGLSRSQIYRILNKVRYSKGRAMTLYVLIPGLDALFGVDYSDQGAN